MFAPLIGLLIAIGPAIAALDAPADAMETCGVGGLCSSQDAYPIDDCDSDSSCSDWNAEVSTTTLSGPGATAWFSEYQAWGDDRFDQRSGTCTRTRGESNSRYESQGVGAASPYASLDAGGYRSESQGQFSQSDPCKESEFESGKYQYTSASSGAGARATLINPATGQSQAVGASADATSLDADRQGGPTGDVCRTRTTVEVEGVDADLPATSDQRDLATC